MVLICESMNCMYAYNMYIYDYRMFPSVLVRNNKWSAVFFSAHRHSNLGWCHTGLLPRWCRGWSGNQFFSLALRPNEVGSPLRAVAADPLCSLSNSFHVCRPQAGFRRENGYFPTMCPEPGVVSNFPRTPPRSPSLAGVKITHFRSRAR